MSILGDKDVNATMSEQQPVVKDVKSMEYHRQVLQSKVKEPEDGVYISPSDNIMSPCTARLTAFRNKTAQKAKPKSLFAKASSKKLQDEAGKNLRGENALGAKPVVKQ